MKIDANKIRLLIDKYGEINNIPKSKRLSRFTEDNNLNYKQWAAVLNGAQDAGAVAVDIFMDIFPDIDLNWFIKDIKNDYLEENKSIIKLEEPAENYKKDITNRQLFIKLNEILLEVKKINGEKMTQK